MTSPADSTITQTSQRSKVAFGPFEFDPAAGELWKNGHKVRLPGQPAEILTALIAHPGEVVTREDLRLRLWPGMSSGGFAHGVNAAVNKLRQVLGDAANKPRYIETLPGRGYRFVAPMSLASPGIPERFPIHTALSAEPPPSRRRLVVWGGLGAAMVVLMVSWVVSQRSLVSLKA